MASVWKKSGIAGIVIAIAAVFAIGTGVITVSPAAALNIGVSPAVVPPGGLTDPSSFTQRPAKQVHTKPPVHHKPCPKQKHRHGNA